MTFVPYRAPRRALGDTAASTGEGASVGATIGTTIFPGIGSVVGGIIGGVVGLAAGLFGGSKGGGGSEPAAAKAAADALPQMPTNTSVAQQIATKWYVLYFGRPSSDPGIAYWTNEIAHDGPQRAWVNFSGSSQPIAANVVGKAAQYQAMGYGDQYSPVPAGLAMPSGVPGSTLPAAPIAIPSPTAQTVTTAGVSGSLTSPAVLIGLAAIIGAVVVAKRKGV